MLPSQGWALLWGSDNIQPHLVSQTLMWELLPTVTVFVISGFPLLTFSALQPCKYFCTSNPLCWNIWYGFCLLNCIPTDKAHYKPIYSSRFLFIHIEILLTIVLCIMGYYVIQVVLYCRHLYQCTSTSFCIQLMYPFYGTWIHFISSHDVHCSKCV